MAEIQPLKIDFAGLGEITLLVRSDGSIFYEDMKELPPKRLGKYVGVVVWKEGWSRTFYVHRLVGLALVANPNKLSDIDHINGDTWDNRMENLRWMDHSSNSHHANPDRLNRTGYKGVYTRGKRWGARINKDKKTYYLGYFDSPEEAHKAYCSKAKELYGEYAHQPQEKDDEIEVEVEGIQE